MKTIMAIKDGKEFKSGEVRRVDDKTAFSMVGLSWKYISKSEWKNLTRNQVGTKSEPSQEQVEKKKNFKQELPDDGKEFVKTRKKSKS
jgi:hypothetical protein